MLLSIILVFWFVKFARACWCHRGSCLHDHPAIQSELLVSVGCVLLACDTACFFHLAHILDADFDQGCWWRCHHVFLCEGSHLKSAPKCITHSTSQNRSLSSHSWLFRSITMLYACSVSSALWLIPWFWSLLVSLSFPVVLLAIAFAVKQLNVIHVESCGKKNFSDMNFRGACTWIVQSTVSI